MPQHHLPHPEEPPQATFRRTHILSAGLQTGSRGRLLALGAPYAWLVLFFLVPFLIVVRLSLSDAVTALPPYEPTFGLGDVGAWVERLGQLDLENYALLFSDGQYLDAYLTSLRIAAVSTLIVLLIGYPVAYAMARAPARWRTLLVMLVILPFWTSFLIRVYAWKAILQTESGILNAALLGAGLLSEPLQILDTEFAVHLGIVYSYLPFLILPVYAALERQDPALLEAAADLGASRAAAFWRITVPLSWPGVVAGCLLVFIPATGEFVIPDLLGGSETLMIGRGLWTEFFSNRDWPLSSAVAVVLVALLIGPILLYQRQQQRSLERGR